MSIKKLNQPIYLLSMLVVLLAILWVVQKLGSHKSSQSEPRVVVSLPIIPLNSSNNLLKESDAAINQAESLLNPKPVSQLNQQVSRSVHPAPAWSLGNTTEMPLPEAVSNFEAVNLDMDSPNYPEPGDQVSLVLPNGENVVATVKTANVNPNGDYSWRGHLDGYGTDYPVVMTYGMNSIFASVTTPKGSFTLESKEGNGWIYKNPSEFELSEPGKNDYLEVPHLKE